MAGNNYSWSGNNPSRIQSFVYEDGAVVNRRGYDLSYVYDGDYPVERMRTDRGNSDYGDYTQYGFTTYYEYADGTGRSNMPQIYTIGAQPNVEDWGGVSGSGAYAAGRTAVLHASPARNDYEFLRWSDGNTDNPRAVTVNDNATYTTVFGISSK